MDKKGLSYNTLKMYHCHLDFGEGEETPRLPICTGKLCERVVKLKKKAIGHRKCQ